MKSLSTTQSGRREPVWRFWTELSVSDSMARPQGEEVTEPPHLLAMLKPYPADAMEAYPVTTRVGSVKNTEAELFAPLEGNTAALV